MVLKRLPLTFTVAPIQVTSASVRTWSVNARPPTHCFEAGRPKADAAKIRAGLCLAGLEAWRTEANALVDVEAAIKAAPAASPSSRVAARITPPARPRDDKRSEKRGLEVRTSDRCCRRSREAGVG